MTLPPVGARYTRQLLLPEVGVEGQRRLAAARVLVVGAGGLGSPALLYLAAAGVGTLGLVDDDVVEETNLQRQVVHGVSDLGRAKTDSAAQTIGRLNPDVTLQCHAVRLTRANAVDILRGYDLVVDGADTFATRYLVGDTCAELGLPHVWASVLRFDAQVSVWWSGRGPCLRCVFPEEPAPDAVPSCAQAGVLGALCGVIGSVQATEALKVLLGVGEPLVGRLLVHDALRQTWDTLAVSRDPACPTCASAARRTRQPERGRTGQAREDLSSSAPTVTAMALADELGRAHPPALVDVRSSTERTLGTLPGSRVGELGELASGAALTEAVLGPRSGRVVLYCRSGVRSLQGAALARAAGWPGAVSLDGGLLAWARDVDPTLSVP